MRDSQDCKCLPMGRGCFRIQFETPGPTEEVLTWSLVDFFDALGFFARWTQGLDLSSLDVGFVVMARF